MHLLTRVLLRMPIARKRVRSAKSTVGSLAYSRLIRPKMSSLDRPERRFQPQAGRLPGQIAIGHVPAAAGENTRSAMAGGDDLRSTRGSRSSGANHAKTARTHCPRVFTSL